MNKGKLAPLLRKAKREGWSKWIKSTADECAVLHGCKFDADAAQHAVEFFPKFLRFSKGLDWARKPFVLMDWQRDDVVAPLFGWKRPEEDHRYRRFKTAYVEVPKKSGKSTLGAGIGNYLFIGDGEPGAVVCSAATKREQAALVHGEAVRMVQSSPALRQRVKINLATKTMSDDTTFSTYQAIASDAKGAEGLDLSGLLCDELHVWPGHEFWDTLLYGFAARKQPVHLIITTAGVFDKTSVGWEQHEYAEKVRDGKVEDGEWLVYIRAAKEKDRANYLKRRVHRAANPSYGVIIDPDEIAKHAARAKNKPTELAGFLRRRLNLWVAARECPIDLAVWDECGGTIDEAELVGRRCHGGLDLASRRDIAGNVWIFPPTEQDPILRVLPRLWAPRDTAVERGEKDGVSYLLWEQQGYLTLTDGPCIRYDAIREQIEADRELFDVVNIGADKWNLEYLRQKLDPEGEYIVEYGQGLRNLSPPTKELLEVLLPQRSLAHGGHPVLRWMAGNLAIFRDGNDNIKPDKKGSKDRIDGMVGLIMAIGMAMLEVDDGESVYDKEERGLLQV